MNRIKSVITLYAAVVLVVVSGPAAASEQVKQTPIVTLSLLKVFQMPTTSATSYSPYVVTNESRILFFSRARKFIEGDKVDLFTLPSEKYGDGQRQYKMCLHDDTAVCTVAKLPSREVKRFDELVRTLHKIPVN